MSIIQQKSWGKKNSKLTSVEGISKALTELLAYDFLTILTKILKCESNKNHIAKPSRQETSIEMDTVQ